MTTFNITDITVAGAYCSAIAAASESDCRHRQRVTKAPARTMSSEVDGESVRNARSGWRTPFRTAWRILLNGIPAGAPVVHASGHGQKAR